VHLNTDIDLRLFLTKKQELLWESQRPFLSKPFRILNSYYSKRKMSKSSMKIYSDKELKDQGNKYFNANKYENAIESYSKAIALNPNVPTYYTNRALCYMKCNRWPQAVQDSKAALERDNGLVKGHFYLGTSLLELDKLDEAIKHLQLAFEMAKKDPSSYYDDTISSKLRVARKKKFALQEEKRVQEEIDLQSYLNRLILEDKDRKMNKLREENESYDEASGEIAKLEEESDKSVAELNNLFAKVDERRQTRDVPDYLCGKISFEILKDPVITPSGITYDRKDIVEHLERVGHFDPVTRTKLTQDMLVPNYAMKEVVDDFVSSNEWSLYY